MRRRAWLMASAGAIFAAASAGVLLLSLKEEGTGMYQGNLPAADEPAPPGLKKATFGAGCFWCSEAVFRRLKGVHSVVPGYSGGRTNDPSYEEVCSGTTGHAEVVQVAYDPAVVSYSELLEVFWRTHDPTTPNRQGNDVGTQYRSVIFYHDDEQRQLAERYKEELNREGVFGRPIVTEIVPFRESYPAEEYHHNFYERNPRQPYCRFVIGPKLEKLREVFADKLQPKAAAGT